MGRTRTPARRTARKTRSRRTQPRRQRGAAVAVSAEQRRHLIADIAFFLAERHRVVAPDGCRAEDRRRAEAEINAVLRRPRKRL